MIALRGKLSPLLAVSVLAVASIVFGVVGFKRYERLRSLEAAKLFAPAGPPPPVYVDPAKVTHASRLAFTCDGPAVLSGFREAEGLDAVIAGAANDEERARRLASWTRAQFDPASPTPELPPDAPTTLAEIRAGRAKGGAPQYAFVLVQALQSIGVPARLVILRNHVGVEAWLVDQSRWTFLDPTYESQVLDTSGTSLAAVAARTQVRYQIPVSLTEGHRYVGTLPEYLDVFDDVGIWMRNTFVGAPMNAADFERYCVWYEEKVGIKARPATSLRTQFPEDLYAPPSPPASLPLAPAATQP